MTERDTQQAFSPSTQAGFALLQIMIALAILGMISAMTWAALQQTHRAKKNGERHIEVYQAGRNAITRMMKDLSMAYLSSNQAPGQELTPRTYFEGIRKSNIDDLRFTYMGHLPLYEGLKEADTAAVAYFSRPNPDPKKRGKLQLIRYESKQIQPVTPTNIETTLSGETEVLCDDVAQLEIWYYHPEQKKWMETWRTTQANGFPSQVPSRVRIKLVLYNDEGKEIPFFSETRIHMFQTLDTSPK